MQPYDESRNQPPRRNVGAFYTEDLAAARELQRQRSAPHIIKVKDQVFEDCVQGLLTHIANPALNPLDFDIDAYVQELPPDGRSGKHRHLAEECVYVIEGKGYDIHQDCDVEIGDVFEWVAQEKTQKLEWEAGDYIYIPPMTIHQHFNADPSKPVRLISCTARIFRQILSVDAARRGAGPEVLLRALDAVEPKLEVA